jgi:hypothetical protein
MGLTFIANCQQYTDTIRRIKPQHLLIGEAAFYGTSMLILSKAWYADYQKSDFHWFNDNNEWLQMDKIGHAYATYQVAYQNSFLLQKTGMTRKKAMWISTGLSIGAISSIELFDGFSAEWGASYGDLIANTSGGLLYLSQELLWKDQKIRMKYSYRPSPYAKIRPELLGDGYPEVLLKDYNAQAYWLSFNLHEITGIGFLPDWAALAIGYSGSGMIGGTTNPTGYHKIKRYRQFFISPDIDWQKIKTKKKGLKILFRAFNMVKIPFPAFSIQKKGLIGHWYR